MDTYITGKTIKELRIKNNLTQNDLALKLNVSDKTISKWETGNGYPDIEMLEPISKVFNISIVELLNGNTITNSNISANLLKTNFYVCPICGNIISAVGESVIVCHGLNLYPLEYEEDNSINISKIENEYYVEINHEMTKKNYISFIAAVSRDRIQLIKLYPESKAEAYFRINGIRYIYYYSNRDGLYRKTI